VEVGKVNRTAVTAFHKWV